jgi:hypothetical protein
MAKLDRQAVLDLLGRLGDTSDETALNAGRELSRIVSESGLTWDDLLRADLGLSDDSPAPAMAASQTPEPDGEVSDADKNEATRLIDRLLARTTLSDTLRDDLVAMKRSIVEGTFDATDRRYVRALAKRLGA